MNRIASTARLAAALVALGVNLALAGGIHSLARHYDEQAAWAAGHQEVAVGGAASCRPERARAG